MASPSGQAANSFAARLESGPWAPRRRPKFGHRSEREMLGL
jgi:hypothetical protein